MDSLCCLLVLQAIVLAAAIVNNGTSTNSISLEKSEAFTAAIQEEIFTTGQPIEEEYKISVGEPADFDPQQNSIWDYLFDRLQYSIDRNFSSDEPTIILKFPVIRITGDFNYLPDFLRDRIAIDQANNLNQPPEAGNAVGKSIDFNPTTDYCALCETPGTHTLCQHPGCPLAGNCTKIGQKHLNEKEKHLLLDYHNQLRSRIATGKIPGQPKATNMNELIWDSELEYIAQCWANQCQFEHDKCRNTKSDTVGQNICYFSSTSYEYVINTNLTDFVDSWLNEYHDLPKGYVKSVAFDTPKQIGHYTQLAWAETSRLGCARVISNDDPFTSVYLFCNYGPTGNWIGDPIYKTGGAPASQCPAGRKPSTHYEGLCI